jgi:hypothetical protein
MQKIDTPKGNEKYFRTLTSNEKMALRRRLSIEKFTLFSDSIFRLRK